MRILAFSDVHANISYLNKINFKIKKFSPDLVICSGDVFNFWTYSKDVKEIIQSFDITTLLIHGNHENSRSIDKLCSNKVINIHKKIFQFSGYNFIGYGGGGFSREDKMLERYMDKIKDKLKNWVFITHGPPYNTRLDLVNERHVGSKSIRKIIEKNNPILSICGHLHENFEVQDKINKTKIINPGPLGMIIEI